MASYDIMGYDDIVSSSFDREDNAKNKTAATAHPHQERPQESPIEETIHRMQGSGMCIDPIHYHSFRSLLLPPVFHSCAFCEQRIRLIDTSAAVKCVACGTTAHRNCALKRRTVKESLKCQVNEKLLSQQQKRLPHQTVQETPQNDVRGFSPETFPAMAQALQDNVMTSYSNRNNGNVLPPRKKVSPYPAHRSSAAADQHATNKRVRESNTIGSFDDDPVVSTNDNEILSEETSCKNNLDQPQTTTTTSSGSNNNMNHMVGVIAGSLAGGVAGLALAGPAGAYAGYITAGSVLVEGGVAWSLVAAGIGMGGLAAGQMKKRVLELGGENGNSTVLLVRPSVQVDPIWNTFYAQAQRSAPSRKSANQNNRDLDIVQTGEDEIDTNDKILLLVNRTLNDKSSVSGHVFRHLVKVFHDRCKTRAKLCRTNDSIAGVSPRARRDDVHAVIKFVTASLMEDRSELGASPHFTEITASAVESLVFGLLYDAVFEEIVEETSRRDVDLWRKITIFEQRCHGAKKSLQSLVSKAAVEALKMLPASHSTSEKLLFCVKFLDAVSEHFVTQTQDSIGADSLIKMVCQHLVLIENSISCYSQVAFLEEFSRDEELLRGREGYALVTLQACLHLLQASTDLQADVFYSDSSTVDDIPSAAEAMSEPEEPHHHCTPAVEAERRSSLHDDDNRSSSSSINNDGNDDVQPIDVAGAPSLAIMNDSVKEAEADDDEETTDVDDGCAELTGTKSSADSMDDDDEFFDADGDEAEEKDERR